MRSDKTFNYYFCSKFGNSVFPELMKDKKVKNF